MAIILNDNVDTRAPKPTDDRFGPYTTTAAALAGIPNYQRYVGLTVGVGTPIVEWWFDSTLTLVLKTTSGTVTGITAGTGINITGTVNPTISVTTPTQLTTNISTDVITDQASDTKYPSVKAVKTYVDANVAGLLDDRGNFAASPSPGNYPTTGGSGPAGAIVKGDIWFISVPGFLNTTEVGIGASVRALVDNPGVLTDADWDILDTGLGFIPENVANKVLSGSSITSDPNSETKYASLKALTEYLASIPASTPTLEQVLAVTPDQTSAGYDINLESLDGNLTTNVGRGEFNVTNVSAGTSVTAVDDTIAIASVNDEVVIASDMIEFTNDTLGTLTITAVPNNNTLVLPNQNATLVASVNSTIFADASTGDITIPYVGGTGTENYVPKWSASTTLADSQIFDNGTNVGVGTATPAYKLDVVNTATPQANYARFTNEDGTNKNAIILSTSASSAISLFGASSERKLLIGNGIAGLAPFVSYNDNIINFTYSDALGGAKNPASLVTFTPQFVYSTGTNNHTILDIHPEITITGGTNTLRGIYYNPNNTTGTPTTHIAFENTTGDNYLNSSSGKTIIGYAPSSFYTPVNKLEVNGEIYTNTGIRVSVTNTKTGIYPYDNYGGGLDFFAASNRLATFRLTNPGGQHYLFDAGHTYGLDVLPWNPTASMVIKGNVSPTGPNSVPITQLLINPEYSQEPSGNLWGTGTLRGIYYNPTVTSLNTSTHIAFENTSGDNAFNSSSGKTAFFGQVGIGTTSPSTSAKVQIDSTTQGFLPPRMTQSERLAIVSPAEGLIVYDTTNSALGVYSGGGWRKLSMEAF